jgi:dolichyl-phosphate-mannose-protein mannosyltransferase
MGRQLFLHHYLPAHLASTLVTGALIEFVFNVEPLPEIEASRSGKKGSTTQARRPVREKISSGNLYAAWAATAVVYAAVMWGFFFFAPLTYGKPGLSIEQVNARKWLNYDLHFAK